MTTMSDEEFQGAIETWLEGRDEVWAGDLGAAFDYARARHVMDALGWARSRRTTPAGNVTSVWRRPV